MTNESNSDVNSGLSETNLSSSQGVDLSNYLPKDEVSKNYLSKDEVNKIVADQKKSAFEKGYQKAFENPPQENTNKNLNLDQGEVRKIIEEELKKAESSRHETYKKQQEQEAAYKVLQELSAKVADAETRYSDYKETVEKVDYINNLPDILELSNIVDNSGDVLYELAKNPMKIAGIRGLPPNLAMLEMQRLSQSIKANQISAKKELPKDPLSRMHSSNVGTITGNEKKGVQYWKNHPDLKP